MLHQVGVSFDLYYDAWKHKIKIKAMHCKWFCLSIAVGGQLICMGLAVAMRNCFVILYIFCTNITWGSYFYHFNFMVV